MLVPLYRPSALCVTEVEAAGEEGDWFPSKDVSAVLSSPILAVGWWWGGCEGREMLSLTFVQGVSCSQFGRAPDTSI